MMELIRKCEICYKDLASKRTLNVGCHEFHRTCILNWCELNIGKQIARCPVCDNPFDEVPDFRDELNARLPYMIGYGPTGQPSILSLAMQDSTYVHEVTNNLFISTSEWIIQISKHMYNASVTGKSEEYIQDIVDERDKMLKRFQILIKIQEELAEREKRIEEAVRPRVEEDASDNAVDYPPVESAAAAEEEEASTESNEEICCICREALSKKRSVVLDVCKHSLHETCALQLYENRSKRRLSCCLCRRKSSNLVGDDDVDIFVPCDKQSFVFALKATRDHFERLLQQKKLAIRDGKSEEYIADIDEGKEILKQRKMAIDREYFLECERQLIRKGLKAAAAAAESAAVPVSDMSDAARMANEASTEAAVGGDPMEEESVATRVRERRRRRAAGGETVSSAVIQPKRRR